VVLTVPASFDPWPASSPSRPPRRGLPEPLRLLEEPQAALYAWIQQRGPAGARRSPGDVILVVDIGGGTTDFSLIAVREREGNLELERVAVGEHILLGGDNMDLALAYTGRRKLAGRGHGGSTTGRLRALTHACRAAKEALLSDPDLRQRAGGGAEPRLEADRRLDPHRGAARGARPRCWSRASSPEVAVTEMPISRGRAPRSPSSACPMRRTRRHPPPGRLPHPPARRHAELEGFAAQPEDAQFLHPTAVLFNGGVLKSG
jgi:hypothetical protein